MANPLSKEAVFELAKQGKLFAGNLLAGKSSTANHAEYHAD